MTRRLTFLPGVLFQATCLAPERIPAAKGCFCILTDHHYKQVHIAGSVQFSLFDFIFC